MFFIPFMLALTPTQVSTEALAGNCQSPRWSPDGKQLAWEVNFHDKKTVEQYTWKQGAKPVKVIPVARGSSAATAGFSTAASDLVVHELSWSPPAFNNFVYSASGADRDYDLYLNGGSKLSPGPGADGNAAWSPDGHWIAFTSARSGQGDIYLLDVFDMSKPAVQLTKDPTASELYAAWSPDSKKLAFVGHTKTGDTIWLIDDINAPAPKPVASLGNTQTRPSFSPDGRSIAFYSNHKVDGRFDLYVMALGGTPRLLVEGVVLNEDGPQWLPDGKNLVFVKDDDERFDPLMKVPAAGGTPLVIETGTVGNGDHDVVKGPDGKTWLAITAQGTSKGSDRDYKNVYIMALD